MISSLSKMKFRLTAIKALPLLLIAKQVKAGGLENPIYHETIVLFFSDMLTMIIILSVPIIVVFLVYGGYTYVTARGNDTKLTKANKIFFYSILGGLFILGGFLILGIIQGTIDSFNLDD